MILHSKDLIFIARATPHNFSLTLPLPQNVVAKCHESFCTFVALEDIVKPDCNVLGF